VTKVLYVEHSDDNLYMLKTRLELRGGFEVLAAEDSEKGCRLAATEHPDVILMDSPRETTSDLADFHQRQGHAPRFARKGRQIALGRCQVGRR
jgi:CheY-like chemotaxis protein